MSSSEQRQRKVDDLHSHIREIIPGDVFERLEFVAISNNTKLGETQLGGLRDRVDLLLDQRSGSPRLGLFDRFKTGVVDLEGCPQLSLELEKWLQRFRRFKILAASTPVPIQRGSVRLRVSPSGQRGVWLDFANLDVKRLLDEGTILRELLSECIVEIGQRRKRLVLREDGQLKLSDPVLEPWFATYSPVSEKPLALYCTIGSFTQPGFRANHALVKEALKPVQTAQIARVIEFGSGIGNFTLPLAQLCNHVEAFEVDELALQGLSLGAEKAGIQIGKNLVVHAGNFQIERSKGAEFAQADLIFVDPPRSGLMKFLDPLSKLERAQRPRHFVYVSCFAESFALDARRLVELGYQARTLSIVDQFPHSRHYEIVASFSTQD